MSENFVKFNYKIQLNWNVDAIVGSITNEYSNEKNTYEVFNTNTKKTYWQVYPYTGTIFSRNFYHNFPKESLEIIEQLKIIQSMATEADFADPKMYQSLMTHKFDATRVNLIKTKAGANVLQHIDQGRKYVLNIGLKNSNTCTTYISSIIDRGSFWQNSPTPFTMEDNEVYMVNVDAMHAVRTNVTKESGIDRYLITYCII